MSTKANAHGAGGALDEKALTQDGAEYAQAFLDRLQHGTAQPGELAVVLAFLQGELLHGACRVIERALGVRHV